MCKLVVQAQPLALRHTLECPCTALVGHTKVVCPFCNSNLTSILRQAKDTAVLHPRISASHNQHALRYANKNSIPNGWR